MLTEGKVHSVTINSALSGRQALPFISTRKYITSYFLTTLACIFKTHNITFNFLDLTSECHRSKKKFVKKIWLCLGAINDLNFNPKALGNFLLS